MNIQINKKEELQLQDLDQTCYFCSFAHVIHRHHIIPKSVGGLDEAENLVSLCPNCHAILHKKIYYLQFSQGFLIMIKHSDNSMIFPAKEQRLFQRSAPYKSIANIDQKKMKVNQVDMVDKEVDNAPI